MRSRARAANRIRSVPARRPGVRRIWPVFLVTILAAAGCGELPRNASPAQTLQEARIPGFDEVRGTPIKPEDFFAVDFAESFTQERRSDWLRPVDGRLEYASLLISGGADYGAFGAGLLNGWSAQGTRPTFKVVTGVSTGALTAPLAFLGSDYDDELKEAFTTITAKNVFIVRGFFDIVSGTDAATDTAPLRQLIATYVDRPLLDRVAEENAKGRRLYVLTTNLDLQLPVVWNMGLIAASPHPDALTLFRDVLLASASVPGAFPPVMIDVEVNGRAYDEMHVDGGVVANVFFVYSHGNLQEIARRARGDPGLDVRHTTYVIRNGVTKPEAAAVDRDVLDILVETLSASLKYSAIWDLYRLYLLSVVRGDEYRYLDVPDDFEPLTDDPFDQRVMQALYQRGYALGRAEDPWDRAPPYFELGSEAPRKE